MPQIEVFANHDELSRAGAEKFVALSGRAIEANNRFTVALAGGSTPKSLYKLLAEAEFRFRIDWRKVYFFWGDERFVSPDSSESNFKMANDNLLKPLSVSRSNVFRFKPELGKDEAAADYEKTLSEFFELNPGELPRFDLILLGMGADGHTASLFPNSEAVNEAKKLVLAPFVEKLGQFRLTLTPPVINNAAQVIFLVAGKEKSAVLKQVLRGEFEPQKFPSQIVRPTNGKLIWLIESSAYETLRQ